MVQINLLPVVQKKEPKLKIGFKIDLGPILFIWAGAFVVIVAAWAFMGLQLSGKQKTLTELDAQIKSLKFTLEKVQRLKKDKELLSQRLEFMRHTIKRDVLWAKNLNRLSNLIPQSIWLHKLSLSTKTEEDIKRYERLAIEGTVVSLRGQEVIDIIGMFMKAIQNDRIFAEQFSEVKLVSSQRKKSGRIEIMDFQLSCQFR